MHTLKNFGVDLSSMVYQTCWALILGFLLSGCVQAFVPRNRMREKLGNHGALAVSRATLFGSISSSCSYAASALAHSMYKKGADLTSSMIFMFASTNLVIDLGLVTWRMISWQMALAELVGGLFIIAGLWLLLPRIFPYCIEGDEKEKDSEDHELQNRATLSDAIRYAWGDFSMMRIELALGFVGGALLMALVPQSFWHAFFYEGHGFAGTLENVVIAPIVAVISLVCSMGNVPLAAALWHSGVSFGGTISFIMADLLSLPLLFIYKSYFGKKAAAKLIGIFWFVISASGLVTEELFKALGLVKSSSNSTMMSGMNMSSSADASMKITWGLNGYLDILALLILAAAYIYKSKKNDVGESFAVDPICGMQVRKSDAPSRAQVDGVDYFFCMEGCKSAFLKKSGL